MSKILEIKIPMLPPSANAIYAPVNLGRKGQSIIMKKGAVEWIKQATLFLPPRKVPDNVKLRMELEYHANWYTKDGSVKQKDVRNYEKLVCDTVCRRYGINDKLVWESLVTKVQSDEKEYVMVKLYTIEAEGDERGKEEDGRS